MNTIYYVGMDVHKETVEVSVFKGMARESEFEKTFRNDLNELKRFFTTLSKKGSVKSCYEAGCLGYTLQRYLEKETGIECIVIAPGSIPRMATDRIKTDRRDARNLAKLLRSEQLTQVNVPTPEDEAAREYIRSRSSVQADLKREKQRLHKFLLRNGYKYESIKYWTKSHRAWMNAIVFQYPLQQETFDSLYSGMIYLEDKLKRMNRRIEEIAQSESYREQVNKQRCLKGIDHLTALAIVSEIGDFRRFKSAESFMAYLGLVPREFSSGEKVRRGSITKCGNSHIRLLLVEAAWHYVSHKGTGVRVVERRKGQDAKFVAYAERCETRLRRKYNKMLARSKTKQVAITAVARELAGFIWGVMTEQVA